MRDSPLLAQCAGRRHRLGTFEQRDIPRAGFADRSRGDPSAGAAPGVYDSRTIHMATGRGGYVGLVRVEEDRLDIAAAFDADFVKSAGGLGLAAEAILREVAGPYPAIWPMPRGRERRRSRASERSSRSARPLRRR